MSPQTRAVIGMPVGSVQSAILDLLRARGPLSVSAIRLAIRAPNVERVDVQADGLVRRRLVRETWRSGERILEVA